MAKKKEIVKKRFDTVCTYCGIKYDSDILENIPTKCCKFELTINDHLKMLSKCKKKLK